MAEINHYLSDDEAFKLDVVSVRLVKAKEPVESDEQLTSPEAVVRALAGEMAWYDREVVGVINFDTKMRPVNVNFVSAGALDYSLAHPREILKSAMLSNAASMMMIHNHPSQDLTPSRADVEITDRMVRLGELAGIPLLDHIIIGKNGREYFSFAEKKAMPVIKLRYKSSYEKIDFSHVAENEENFSVNVSRLSEALDETNTILESTSGQQKNVTESVTNVSEKINEYKNEQMTLPLNNFEFDDEDGYLHFTVTVDDYGLEGLFRIHDPGNGNDMELVSIDYGYLHPAIEQQWSSIEERLKQAVMQREMTDVKASIETESEYEEISSPRL